MPFLRIRVCLALVAVAALCPSTGAADSAAEKGTLVVRVIDAESGALLPARVVIAASDGSFPGDRLGLERRNWPGLVMHGTFIAGEQSFQPPPGKATITAAHGCEYSPATAAADVLPGKTATVELRLVRFVDLRRLGWVCGDAHLHMIHGEMQRPTSYADVATTCAGAGLDWACVNQEYVGAGELDAAGYRAECAKVSTPGFTLLLGGERPKSLFGHHALIGVADPFIIPDDPPYHLAARDVHAQAGVLFPVHPARYYPEKQRGGEWFDFPGNNLGREMLFDALLGPSFDGLSVLSDEPYDETAHALWFNLLNRGLFVPALADSDACFDRPTLGFHAPGFWNNYLFVGPEASRGPVDGAKLAEAVRRGRVMATSGPLVQFSIDDQISGATLRSDGQSHTVRISAWHPHHVWTLEPNTQIAKIELIRNGKVVRMWEPGVPEVTLAHKISETEPCWYAARVFGSDGKWQVALASPIYFAATDKSIKQPPLTTTVRGRIYDFISGAERAGQVEVRRGEQVLKRFAAEGQFQVRMPADATITVTADGVESISHTLLEQQSLHHFLWSLRREDMGRPETLAAIDKIVERVDLEFPLGYKMAGCYRARALDAAQALDAIRVVTGPPDVSGGSIAAAAVLLDVDRITPGETFNVAALFHDESGEPDKLEAHGKPGDRAATPRQADMRLVIEGRAYDAKWPSGFGPLKLFGSVEADWSKAAAVGQGYRLLAGKLTVPAWASAGPVGAIELNIRSRAGRLDGAFVGLRLPLGPTRRMLSLTTPWPTIPISWPDHSYGIGPLALCGKNGRTGQCRADYRQLQLEVTTSAGKRDLLPARDCRGCDDASDAIYTGQFFDQTLNDESHLTPPQSKRPQPNVIWRELPIVDATGDSSDRKP